MPVSFWLRAVVIPLAAVATSAFFVLGAVSTPTPPMISCAVIAVGLAAFVLLADLASLTTRWLQNSFVMLATLCLGLAGIEAYASRGTTAAVSHGTSRAVSRGPGLVAVDPVLGARPSGPGRFPAHRADGDKVIYDVVYTIDQKRRRLTTSNPDGPRVVFFGDSWTFGEGLNDADTLPQAFANLTGANVVNYGFEGASPAQTLRAMETGAFDKDITGARLFILQTAPFHIPRTACLYVWNEGSPHYRSNSGKAVYHGLCKAHWWQHTGTYKMLLEPFHERINGDNVEVYLDMVDRIAELARDKYRAALLIVDDAWLQPYLMDSRIGFSTRDVEARFKATGAMVIDNETEEKNVDRLEIPGDMHPTALANRLIAKKIVATLAAERPKLLDGMPEAANSRPEVSRSAAAQPRKTD